MISVNRETAARLAASVCLDQVEDALAHVCSAGNAIYAGRHHLGMGDDEARDFAFRFVAATMDELVELWRRPPAIQ